MIQAAKFGQVEQIYTLMAMGADVRILNRGVRGFVLP